MQKTFYFLSLIIFSLLLASEANAICVNNKTDMQLYYEIYNQNSGCPAPKIKFYSGNLQSKQKICYAHSANEGNDWKIFRYDLIKVYKIQDGKKQLVCTKNVSGILNILKVSFTSNPDNWWCFDRSDNQD